MAERVPTSRQGRRTEMPEDRASLEKNVKKSKVPFGNLALLLAFVRFILHSGKYNVVTVIAVDERTVYTADC